MNVTPDSLILHFEADSTTLADERASAIDRTERGQTDKSDSDRIRILSLSANPTASFYERQVQTLEACGVECTTTSPPPYDRSNGRSPWQYLKVWAEALREVSNGYDLIHANYGLVGPIALAQPKRPVVLTLWGTDVMSDGWVSTVSKSAARFCDAVVAPSRRLAESLPCESYVVQFDVNTDLFRPIPQREARSRLGWDADAEIVLFPYGDREVKNYPMARRVVDDLSRDAELRRVSGADHEDMPLYYNACDALVVTSEREAGPMVVKEAAACNVPVVSTDVGFTAELLDDVRNSYAVSSEDTFVERLEEVLGRGGRSDGRSIVEQEDDVGEQLRSIYEQVV
jgi:hypothetical protein